MKGISILASLFFLGTAEDKIYDATFSWNDDAWKRFESGYKDMQAENMQVHNNFAKEAQDQIQKSYLKAKGETELVFGKVCTPLGQALDRYKKWGQVSETCDTQCALEVCLNDQNWTFDEDCVRHTCECRLVNPNPDPESANYDPQELEKFNSEVGQAKKAASDYVSAIFQYELELHKNLTDKYTEAKEKIEANEMEFIRKQLKNIASCNNSCVNKCTNPNLYDMDDLSQCLDSCDCELTAVDFEISQRNSKWNPDTLLAFN